MIEPNSIIHGDCLEVMKDIADKSIDCIIADLPYGLTQCLWDSVIPFEPLWEQYKRIIKPNGAIVLFGSQPFTSALVMSNPKWFKYEWIWSKTQGTTPFDAKKKPMKAHENIIIFCEGRYLYNPQMEKAENLRGDSTPRRTAGALDRQYKSNNNVEYRNNVLWKETGLRYPKSVIKFSNNNGIVFGRKTINAISHPTQKPVPLLEYLIKTYTIECELILDNTAGSGSLAIAAINTKRNYICIEKDDHYFEVMSNRIANHDPNAPVKKPKVKAEVKGQLVLF